MAKKVTINGSNLLSDLSQDWGGRNTGDSAQTIHGTSVPAGAEWGLNRGEIERFIKEQFKGKAGVFHYDQDTSKYLVFADDADRDLYLSDREEYAELLIGTFDAPANYTAEINMSTPNSNTILKGSTGNYIDFTFDVKTKTGSSTGEAVVATYTFNNGGNIKKETRIYDAGTNVHFLVDEYLSEGTNSISVSITGRNTLASSMAAVTYTMVHLELTSTFNFAVPVTKGSYLHVPYTLKGANVKYVEWYVDGVKENGIDTVVGVNTTNTKDFDTASLTPGKHNVQVRAYITEGGTNYYSNTLYFDFVVAPSSWESNTTYTLLGLVLAAPVTSGTLSVSVKQYETFTFKTAVYDSRSRALDLVITDNGTQVKSVAMTTEEVSEESYTPTTTGNHVLLFTADSQTATFTVAATAGDITITKETNDLLLELSAKGRSNTETHPDTWTFQQAAGQGGNLIESTFTGFEWNGQSGWKNDALVIPAGANVQIGLNPLAGNPITKGRTIEIDFETLNIDNEAASVLSLLSGTTGLSITPTTAKLQTAGGAKVETKFRDGDRVHLTFIVNRTDDTNNMRMLYIVNNGILERAAQFAASDVIGISGDSITIGSSGCTVKLYGIRVYDKALNVDQAFCNFAVDSPNIVKIATDNDIYDNLGNIDVDKVNAHIPVMIITGDISSIMSISDKSHKNDWNSVPVDIEFRNMQHPEMNFFIDDADIRLQGTSSISYPRKNFRIYSTSKSGKYNPKLYVGTHTENDLVTGGKYAFKEGSAPVSCWCLKADFAESSGSHNTGVAKLWNKVMKSVNHATNGHILRTAAQNWAETNDYPYDVRTTIDGFPIVLFQRDSANSQLVCLGQYNFNNDKSTEDVYGFTALTNGEETFDNSHVECWEVLDSDNSIALFTDITDFDNSWGDAFEARYPDKNKNVTALKRVCQFLNSCYDSSLENPYKVATWQAGKADYFDLNKLAAYYIYLRRFGAVDQTVKNAMFTTEDGLHWFYINYDNDTILGIDNESRQFDTWDYGLTTQTPDGGYYYAGKGKSVLWNLFEADTECMALARQIDALLFNAGLTYEEILKVFDDEQSSQWCERIYNENGRYKYISQALAGQNVLHMLQGSRKSHRHWWLQHRMEKLDNTFGNGTYGTRLIQARATGTANIPQGATYKFTPAITSNFGYAVASTTVDVPTERTAGVEVTSTGLPQETGVGNFIYIFNANNIAAIDLSGYITALGSLSIGDAVDVNGNSRLTKLVLGDGEHTNAYLNAISGLNKIKSLEEINIKGFTAITSMELGTLENLHKIYAANSGLTSFAPAAGVTLTAAELPSTLQVLSLDGANVASLTYTPTTALRSVSLKNVGGAWDAKSFVNTWLGLLSDAQLAAAEITLHGINWTGMTVAQVLKLGAVGTKSLRGKVTLSSLDQEGYNQLVEVFGASVFQADGAFTIDAPANVFISGPTKITEGGIGTFTGVAFPVSDAGVKYLLYNGSTLIEAQTDAQSRVYRKYNGVTLYEATGVMTVDNGISADVTVNVRAQVNGTYTYSDMFAVTAEKYTYPTSVIITGDNAIDRNSTKEYTKSFNTNDFNTEITNVAWSLATNSIASITESGNDSAKVTVTGASTTAVQLTLTCTVTFTGGVTRSASKTITVQLTVPSSITIGGDVTTITEAGDYEFPLSFNPSVYTAQLVDMIWALTSDSDVSIKSHGNTGAVLTLSIQADHTRTLTLSCAATFEGNIVRQASKTITVQKYLPEGAVDLGLPSGLLWRNKNVGANSETDYGEYFSWGNITGHKSTNGSTFDDSYDFGTSNSGPYASTPGASIQFTYQHKNADYAANSGYDAARENLGGLWRMPTATEFKELYDNTDNEWTSINGVYGRKFMKKTDHSVYVFFPAAGYGHGTSLRYRGSLGLYWFSSLYSADYGYYLNFDSSSVYPQSSNDRYRGSSVRAVQ